MNTRLPRRAASRGRTFASTRTGSDVGLSGVKDGHTKRNRSGVQPARQGPKRPASGGLAPGPRSSKGVMTLTEDQSAPAVANPSSHRQPARLPAIMADSTTGGSRHEDR